MLPDTVQGVIRARLDNLDAHALEIVRVASVIGWEFDHALLAEVVPPTSICGRRSPRWKRRGSSSRPRWLRRSAIDSRTR